VDDDHVRPRIRWARVAVPAALLLAGCGGSATSRSMSAPPPPRPSAYLGVTVFTSARSDAMVVTVTRGGPAQRAGIKPGDDITAVAGEAVGSPVGLLYVMKRLHPDQTVRIQATGLSGATLTRTVTLARAPARLTSPSTRYLSAEAL
jgi:S1-C subfamily serine protease